MSEKETIRLNFIVPIKEHIMIKKECVESRSAMKDFLRELVLLGYMAYLKKKQAKEEDV